MGSKLIIKNADFSENGIVTGTLVWYLGYDESYMNADSPFSSTNRFYIIPSEITANNLDGKEVSYVKVYAKISGSIKISQVNVSGSSASAGTEYNYLVNEGINIIKLTEPITLSTTKSIGFIGMNILSFWPENASSVGWEFKRTGATTGYGTRKIVIDFGYMSLE